MRKEDPLYCYSVVPCTLRVFAIHACGLHASARPVARPCARCRSRHDLRPSAPRSSAEAAAPDLRPPLRGDRNGGVPCSATPQVSRPWMTWSAESNMMTKSCVSASISAPTVGAALPPAPAARETGAEPDRAPPSSRPPFTRPAVSRGGTWAAAARLSLFPHAALPVEVQGLAGRLLAANWPPPHAGAPLAGIAEGSWDIRLGTWGLAPLRWSIGKGRSW